MGHRREAQRQPTHEDPRQMLNECYIGDCREGLRAFVAAGLRPQMCVTSPPYWGLRDYGVEGQIGLEPTLADWVDTMVEVFREVREALADDGTVWLNLGDGYSHGGCGARDADRWPKQSRNNHRLKHAKKHSALKPKDLLGQPWRVAFALQDDGWYLRQDIIWSKPSPMPESVKDRCTKSHEYIFLLSKSARYFYDADAIKEPSSPGTHERYARARSPSDYPGNQTIASSFDHMKKPVAGWDTGLGKHLTIEHNRGPKDQGRHEQGLRDSTKFGRGAGFRKRAEAGSGIKNNDSFDEAMAIMPDKRNKRSVWTIAAESYADAHFATFPRKLVEPCILAGSRPGDIVLDPFMGSGTTAQVAEHLGRQWIGCEINESYKAFQDDRLRQQHLALDTDQTGPTEDG